MNQPPRTSIDPSLTGRRALGVAAVITAAFLMLIYVRLLQDSVARGAQWRYSQQNPPAAGLAMEAAARPRLVSTTR